jgi:hypothetical protein
MFHLAQEYDERGLEFFLQSQDAVLDAYDSDQDSSDSGSSEDSAECFRPLYRCCDVQNLSHDMLRSNNRNFLRILEVANQPLSFQQTEAIVSESQSEVVTLLHRVIDQQNRHTTDLRSAVDFFGACHEQTLSENRQLRSEVLAVSGEITQAREDLQLQTIALSLFSERLNILQRLLREIHEALMRR